MTFIILVDCKRRINMPFNALSVINTHRSNIILSCFQEIIILINFNQSPSSFGSVVRVARNIFSGNVLSSSLTKEHSFHYKSMEYLCLAYQIVNVPSTSSCVLFAINSAICNAWIIRIDFESN